MTGKEEAVEAVEEGDVEARLPLLVTRQHALYRKRPPFATLTTQLPAVFGSLLGGDVFCRPENVCYICATKPMLLVMSAWRLIPDPIISRSNGFRSAFRGEDWILVFSKALC